MIELRWLQTKESDSANVIAAIMNVPQKPPVLQYRQSEFWTPPSPIDGSQTLKWSEWQTVPTVTEPKEPAHER